MPQSSNGPPTLASNSITLASHMIDICRVLGNQLRNYWRASILLLKEGLPLTIPVNIKTLSIISIHEICDFRQWKVDFALRSELLHKGRLLSLQGNV